MGRVDEYSHSGSKTPAKGETRFDRPVLAPYEPAPRRAPAAPAEPRRPAPLLSRFDTERLQTLTPFAIPKVTTITRQAGGNLPADSPAQWSRAAYRNQAAARGVELHTPTETVTTEEPGKERTRRTYQLTWDEYNKLDDQQRAAVDFNTELVKAREKDLTNQGSYHPTAEQKATYDESVKQMFGPRGGSDTFAPETLAVLRQVDFKPEAGDDLDNYLGLKNAISAHDLAALSNLAEVPQAPHDFSADAPTRLLTGHNAAGGTPEQRTAAGVTGLQEKLAQTHQLLQSFKASAAANRNEDVGFFGGSPNTVKLDAGYGAPRNGEHTTMDGWFQQYFSAMSQNGADVPALLSEAMAPLKPAERQDFMAFLDTQSQSAERFHLPLNIGKSRTPEEFRKLLGLDGGEQQ